MAEYPAEVRSFIVDPVHGLPSRVARPKLSDIRAACKAAYAPIQCRLRRARIAEEQRARLAAEPAPATAEEKARVQASLERYLTGRARKQRLATR